MTKLGRDYLTYPMRRYGMDHDRYEWSMLSDRAPVRWPEGKRLAFWVNVSLQFFPLNPQSPAPRPPGGMTMPYPDLRHFSLRDYGNRVGIYRMLDILGQRGVPFSCAVNAALAERVPYLMAALNEAGGEFIGHGWDMDSPHHGLSEAEEQSLIGRSLDVIRRAAGQAVKGWLSPGRLESPATPDLLSEAGIEYFADWVNDDMPYRFKTRHRDLTAMPLPTEIEDRFVLLDNLHSEDSYERQLKDAFDWLYQESSPENGRMFGLSLHPWVTGQPHRIGVLENFLEHVGSREGVWAAAPGRIASCFAAAG